ncbi:hypothetical protein PAF17_15980 [Paracoccus sp. Z330]|uniref:Uncharacterized protein n=1 Tax=Paracoccus onchidii TaxID=3017813 RepID=A0ABT4ZI05_9RHOB|nr:hypothetical protein [Paracoccus onchidii]MDB6178991.1 hypothetical protein [Paracoccus onchidii]
MKNEDKGAFKVSMSLREGSDEVDTRELSSSITFDGTGISIEYDMRHQGYIGAFLHEARKMLPEALDAVARNRMVDEITSSVTLSVPEIKIATGQGPMIGAGNQNRYRSGVDEKPQEPEPETARGIDLNSPHQRLKSNILDTLLMGSYCRDGEIERVADKIVKMVDGDCLKAILNLHEIFRERPYLFKVYSNPHPVHAGVYLEIAKMQLRQLRVLL